jgi:hypothetical protein
MAPPEEPARDELQTEIAASLKAIAESLAKIASLLSQPGPPRGGPRQGRPERRFRPGPGREAPQGGYGFQRPGGPGRRGGEPYGPRRRWERGPREPGGGGSRG